MAENAETTEIPAAKNPISREEADKMIVLIKLDIAKFDNEKARSLALAANADAMVAASRLAIADIERRVANVDYPQEQQAPQGQPAEAESEEK